MTEWFIRTRKFDKESLPSKKELHSQNRREKERIQKLADKDICLTDRLTRHIRQNCFRTYLITDSSSFHIVILTHLRLTSIDREKEKGLCAKYLSNDGKGGKFFFWLPRMLSI